MLVALRSIDTSSQVGAVITTQDHVVISQGYNGPIRGFDVHDEHNHASLTTRPDKYMFMEHAERNAIFNALRIGSTVKGAVLFINGLPCTDCCRAICQSGITTVKVLKATNGIWGSNKNWAEKVNPAHTMFQAAGVKVIERDVRLIFPVTIRLNGELHTIQ